MVDYNYYGTPFVHFTQTHSYPRYNMIDPFGYRDIGTIMLIRLCVSYKIGVPVTYIVL